MITQTGMFSKRSTIGWSRFSKYLFSFYYSDKMGSLCLGVFWKCLHLFYYPGVFSCFLWWRWLGLLKRKTTVCNLQFFWRTIIIWLFVLYSFPSISLLKYAAFYKLLIPGIFEGMCIVHLMFSVAWHEHAETEENTDDSSFPSEDEIFNQIKESFS